MDRVFSVNVGSTPMSMPASLQRGYVQGSVAFTKVGPWWYHTVTEELVNAQVALGQTADPSKTNQLATGLTTLVTQITALQNLQQSGSLSKYSAAYISAGNTYPKGAVLLKADGSGIWISQVAANVSNPDTGGAGWDGILPLASLQTQFAPISSTQQPALNSKLQPIVVGVGSNALTVTLNPTTLDFRNPSLASGIPNTRTISSPISLTVPSGATLGTVSGNSARLVVIAMDNAGLGTVELGIFNLANSSGCDETNLTSSLSLTAVSNTAGAVYSTTARTNLPYRVVGFIDVSQATAGTWASAPTLVQGVGGQALASLSSIGYGQTWRDVTSIRFSGVTYYNTSGRPITVSVRPYSPGGDDFMNASFYIDGVLVAAVGVDSQGSAAPSFQMTGVVPNGSSYVFNAPNRNVAELR